jgi:hypothetical protein
MEKIDTILNEYTTMEISNSFFLMNDIERMRKFLVKNFLFSKTNELPGDIVELGVFKGTGFLQLVKLLEIYFPASNKKVIGFDLFNSTNFDNNSTKQLQNYYEFCDVSNNGISKNKVKSYADKLPLANYNPSKTLFKKKKYETIPVYIKENPGLRISLLYCDMDIEKPTFEALNYLYDRVVRGGIIVFDEYACNKWSESNAVDAFLKLHPELDLKSITWSRTPTAYIIKK